MGYTSQEVEPEDQSEECHLVAWSYNDFIYQYTDSIVVRRLWTVIEWNSLSSFSYTQLIFINGTPPTQAWNICDTKANDAPLGDCDSGHTDTDDVEWPIDLTIDDHRITPDDLVAHSGITEENARPQLVSNASNYDLKNIDILDELTSSSISLTRRWTITSKLAPGQSATYDQKLSVNLDNNLAEKVTVSTHGGRAMENVLINNSLTTDDAGVVYIVDDATQLEYMDSDPLNGISVADLALLRAYILGQIELNRAQILSADIDNNGIVSTLDIVRLKQALIDKKENEDVQLIWNFIQDNSYDWLDNNGDFIGYKIGDLDDSALLDDGGNMVVDNQVAYADEVTNIGETYLLDLQLDKSMLLRGAEFNLDIDVDKVSILDVRSMTTDEEIDWKLSEDGTLRIAFTTENDLSVQGQETSSPDYLITIELEAKENATIAQSIRLSETISSILVDDSFQEILLGGKIDNEITSGTDDVIVDASIQAYPNPTTDWVTVTLNNDHPQSIQLYSLTGRLLDQTRDNVLNVSDQNNGMYILKIKGEEKVYVSRLVVKR